MPCAPGFRGASPSSVCSAVAQIFAKDSLEVLGASGEPSLDIYALSHILSGGDDYELSFTASVAARSALHAVATELGLPLRRIGRIVNETGLWLIDEGGRREAVQAHSFDHFA